MSLRRVPQNKALMVRSKVDLSAIAHMQLEPSLEQLTKHAFKAALCIYNALEGGNKIVRHSEHDMSTCMQLLVANQGQPLH